MAATITDVSVPVAAKGWRSWVCTRWTRTWAMMLPSLTGLGQVLSTTDKVVAHDGYGHNAYSFRAHYRNAYGHNE